MGMAVGCVGMSLNDFRWCTPSEFTAIFNAWQQKEETAVHRAWDQSRFLACSMLQPYSKTKLKLTDVAHFSWDTDAVKDTEETAPSTRERFEEIRNTWGR